MTPDMIELIGFAPRPHVRARSRHAAAIAQVITLLALVLSIAVAATAVTIGIARADTLTVIPDDPLDRLAAPALLALAIVGMGGLAVLRSAARANRNERRLRQRRREGQSRPAGLAVVNPQADWHDQ
jgi:hypothetical protein